MFNAGFVLGFVVALAVVGIICRLVGAARLARVFGALAGRPVKISRAVKKSAPLSAVPTAVEADVIAALVNLKAEGAAARRATAAAAERAPQEFEPLFNAALAILRGSKVHAAGAR